VDLHLIPGAEPTPAEKASVDAVLGPPPSGWFGGARRPELEGHVSEGGDAIRAQRHRLLPALWGLQSGAGWISPGGLNYVCQRLDVAPADAYGVATFYAMFSVAPQPAAIAHVCDDIACRLAGAREICAELESRLGPAGGAWRPSPCLGQCERAPAVLFQRSGRESSDSVTAPCDAAAVVAGLNAAGGREGRPPGFGSPSAPQTLSSRRENLLLLSRVGRVDPTSLDAYRDSGGTGARSGSRYQDAEGDPGQDRDHPWCGVRRADRRAPDGADGAIQQPGLGRRCAGRWTASASPARQVCFTGAFSDSRDTADRGTRFYLERDLR